MMQQIEIEETLLKHSLIANEQSKVAEQHTDILLQLTNSYFELLEKVGKQNQVIQNQGYLLSQAMERVVQLEGRSILANFNQRIETLEANQGKFYGQNDRMTIRMMKQLIKRVDDLESWISGLVDDDYVHLQQEENKTGNSSFEEHEMHHPEDTTGTHPPDCSCYWCMPQEGDMVI